MKVACIVLAGVVVACGPATPAVRFQGSAEPALAAPSHIERASTLPRDARRLGTLSVSCDPELPHEAFECRSLADIDCTPARLTRMLEEAGAEAGGNVLVGLGCTRDDELTCRAALARRASAATPLRPSPSDAPASLEAAVRISFVPAGAPPAERAARDGANVRDLPTLPPGHRAAGTLEARCHRACPELAVRDGLRLAAGRLGFHAVVGVRCFAWDAGYRCLGTGAVAERGEDFSSSSSPTRM